MSEGLRRPEGIPSWSKHAKPAPGKGPHPLIAAFADLGWHPSNDVVRWLRTMPRNMSVEETIRRIPPHWRDALRGLACALTARQPPPWELLRLLPAWAVHGTEPVPAKHPAEAWKPRRIA